MSISYVCLDIRGRYQFAFFFIFSSFFFSTLLAISRLFCYLSAIWMKTFLRHALAIISLVYLSKQLSQLQLGFGFLILHCSFSSMHFSSLIFTCNCTIIFCHLSLSLLFSS